MPRLSVLSKRAVVMKQRAERAAYMLVTLSVLSKRAVVMKQPNGCDNVTDASLSVLSNRAVVMKHRDQNASVNICTDFQCSQIEPW